MSAAVGAALVGLLVVGGMIAASGAHPDAPSAPGAGGTPQQWAGFAAQAAATRNPAVMRSAADALQRAGMAGEASALRAAAAAIEAANQAANASRPPVAGQVVTNPAVYQTPGVVAQHAQSAMPALGGLPPAVQQQVTDALQAAAATAAQAAAHSTGASASPPVAVPSTPVSSDPRVAAAESLATHLRATGRYREDRDRVRAFQSMMGLQSVDGMYGTEAAIAIGSLGVLPAKPFYYSRTQSKMLQQKAKWRAFCLDKQQTDRARAAQWAILANVERD